MPCTKETATRRLTARWHEQCLAFPIMRADVPLALYVSGKPCVCHAARYPEKL